MATVKSTSVTSLMTKAQQALARNHWFEAERMCTRALDMARNEGDFNLMARIALPLQEARRQRMQLALDSKKIVTIDEPSVEERKIEVKCYLVQPPLVGADARRMRLLALEREIPAMFLCREPKTQLGLCPVVAIGQVTVRTRIDPPKKWDKPDLAWYVSACEQLGDAAIETLDRTAEPARQVDALLERLDAVPDHEKLHQVLAEVCKEAARYYVDSDAPPRATVKVRTGEQGPSVHDDE
jgi:phage gp36-like protein